MSRITTIVAANNPYFIEKYNLTEGEPIEIAYGLDHVTGYFLEARRSGEEDLLDQQMFFRQLSQGEMIEEMYQWGIDDPENTLLISLDLPLSGDRPAQPRVMVFDLAPRDPGDPLDKDGFKSSLQM